MTECIINRTCATSSRFKSTSYETARHLMKPKFVEKSRHESILWRLADSSRLTCHARPVPDNVASAAQWRQNPLALRSNVSIVFQQRSSSPGTVGGLRWGGVDSWRLANMTIARGPCDKAFSDDRPCHEDAVAWHALHLCDDGVCCRLHGGRRCILQSGAAFGIPATGGVDVWHPKLTMNHRFIALTSFFLLLLCFINRLDCFDRELRALHGNSFLCPPPTVRLYMHMFIQLDVFCANASYLQRHCGNGLLQNTCSNATCHRSGLNFGSTLCLLFNRLQSAREQHVCYNDKQKSLSGQSN